MHESHALGPGVVRRGARDERWPNAAGIALLATAALVLLATLTKGWFTPDHNDGGVGLLGLESCRGALCRSVTWFDVKRVPPQIPIFATTALVACLSVVAFMIHAGVALLRGRPETIRLGWLSQLLGLAALAICAFVFSLSIGDWSRGLALGWSAFVGIVAVVGAALLTIFVVRPLVKE